MWPWEHVLFAYLLYSLYRRVRSGSGPTDAAAFALLFGALFPDLIDKPLSWELGLITSGYAIAHSVFFAIPLSIAVFVALRHVGRGRVGAAFAWGYLLHLIGDVIPISLGHGELVYYHLLWPVYSSGGGTYHGSFSEAVRYHFANYYAEIVSLDPSASVRFQLALVAFGLLLWVIDGCPGVGGPIGFARRSLRRRAHRER